MKKLTIAAVCILLVSPLSLVYAERGLGRPGALRAPVNVNRALVNRDTVNRTVVNHRGVVNGSVWVAPAAGVYVAPGCVWVPAYTDSNGDVIPGYQSC